MNSEEALVDALMDIARRALKEAGFDGSILTDPTKHASKIRYAVLWAAKYGLESKLRLE